MEADTLVKVEKLKKHFPVKRGIFVRPLYIKAVDGVSFEVHNNEIFGLAGESGCGKTTIGRLLASLDTPTEGHIYFVGNDLAKLRRKELKSFRKDVQMIFQDPYESLNPQFTVLRAILEPLLIQKIGSTYEERLELITKALEDCGMRPAEAFIGRYPHELSGGQRQRVAVARALVVNPKFMVADEPVSMLDVSIRAGVLNLMLNLRDKYHISFVFITHDISVSRYMCDRIGVMYLGRIVEVAKTDHVIFSPAHPYTEALLSAVPIPDPELKHGRTKIKGEVPSAIDIPSGCRFHPRCPYRRKGKCDVEQPPVIEVAKNHYVECHYPVK